MNVKKIFPTTLSVLIILASVTLLAVSPAGAADPATSTTAGQGTVAHGPGGHHGVFNATMHVERLQSMITKLGKNGIDITQVQADLSADNTAAVLSWFRTYHKDHPQTLANRTWTKPPVNATQQAEHLQSMITNLGKTGADITQVQTDLSAGNTAAVLTWFQAYHKDHPVAALNAYGNKTGTRTTGDFFPKFAGHAMNSGNRSAMNGTPMARHPGCSGQAP